MALDERTRILEELSDLTIAGLKKIAEEGRKLTSESLAAYLKNAPKIRALMDRNLAAQGGHEKKIQPEELDRLKAQKEKLVRQLRELEDRLGDSEKVYKRAVLFLSDFVRTESGGALDEHVANVKGVLKLKSNPEMVEEAFEKLKTAVLHGDVSQKGPDTRKKSLVSRLMSRDSSSALDERVIEQFRGAYQEIVDELGLDLGLDFLPRLLNLGKRINSSMTFDDFTDLRKDILDLLHNYMSAVAEDRSKAAGFIKDIGRKLVEVEMDLVKFLDFTDDVFTANSRFGNSLIDDLNDLETSVGFSQKIDELKEVVNAKLALIKKAVQKKNETDRGLKSNLDNDMGRLKLEFERLKTEAMAAKEQAERFEQEMFTDPLTGASNRRSYDKRITEEFDRYLRYKRPFSGAIFDVDHFKTVNDTYGHATGDTCLKEIIKRVAPVLRESDRLARYGGEEFVIIFPETDPAGAKDACEKLRKIVEKIEFVHRETSFRITISFGVSGVQETDRTPADLFNRMDTALYEAKKGGRNRVVVK
jgi:diguanylate cyclase (GGDEF)-like protein